MSEQISVAVTAYNESGRGEFVWIRQCISPASESDLVREIVIVNDATLDYAPLCYAIDQIPKVTMRQNAERLHVFGNKLESVYQASSEWVLLCDSDNIMAEDYYDRLRALQPWEPYKWYCASFARPDFDYRGLIGEWDLYSVEQLVKLKHAWCFLNTGNQFVNRDQFLSIFGHLRGKRFDLEQPNYFDAEDREDEKWFLAYGAQDSIYLMKEWLIAGRSVECVQGLEYDHRTGQGKLSNYNRASKEKITLGPVYYLEMLDHVGKFRTEWSSLPQYRFDHSDGAKFFYRVLGTDRMVSVDTSTGAVE